MGGIRGQEGGFRPPTALPAGCLTAGSKNLAASAGHPCGCFPFPTGATLLGTITESCLSEATILAVAEGAAAPADLDAAQTHLDSCPTCRRLLVAVTLAGSEPTSSSSGEIRTSQPVDLPVGRGTRIGRYLVTGVLGAGGMGAVYSADDPELDRRVAVKLVHHSACQPENPPRVDRLRREARAMARLDHVNVVQVFDVGAHGSRTFIAMELVEGRTLRAWAHAAHRSTREVVAAYLEAGRGLSAAHEAGLLHRDFKPDNVFVAKDGRVKVGDFGLARPVEPVGPAEPSPALAPDTSGEETLSGHGGGTLAYLAPEVIAGAPASVASDQFSFCVSLWESLHGKRPFTGKTAYVLLQAIRAGDVQQPPSRRVPGWLRKALLRGLAADPAARHPSMAALLRALDPKPRRTNLPVALASVAALALAGLTLAREAKARCTGAAAELAPAWGESRRAALGAAFRAAGQGPAWTVVERALNGFADQWVEVHSRSCRATRVEGHQSEEILQRRTACLSRQREVVAALGDLWLSGDAALLAKAPLSRPSLPHPGTCAGAGLLNAPKMADPAPAIADRAAELRQKQALVSARMAAGETGPALTLAREVALAAKGLAHAPVEAEALLGLGRVLKERGDYEEAERTLHDATLAAVSAGHDQVLAEAMVLLARVVGISRARSDEGEVLLARAAPVVSRLGDRMLSSDLEFVRGDLRLDRGDAEGARAIFAGLLPVLEPLVGKDHPSVGDVHHSLFLVANALGRSAEARVHAEAALHLYERAMPPEHPRLYPAVMDLAVTEQDLGNLAAARQLFERALRIAEKSQGPDGPQGAAALGNLASVLSDEGDSAGARAASERALKIAIARGPTHPFTAYLEVAMGERAWQEGSVSEALAHLRRGTELRESRYGRKSLETAEVLALLGRARIDAGEPGGLSLVVEADALAAAASTEPGRRGFTAYHACEALLEAGRPQAAAPHCQRLLATVRHDHPEDHPAVVDATRLLAEVELAQGRRGGQRAPLEAALGSLEKRTGSWPRVLVAVRFTLARVLARDPDRAARARSSELARSALELARRIGMRRTRLAPMKAFLGAG